MYPYICLFARWTRPCSPKSPFLLPIRVKSQRKHITTVSSRTEKIVNVPVGGSGSVKLHIRSPSRPGKSLTPNVLIYLPPSDVLPGASLANDAPETTLILSSHLPTATIVTLNYRLSPLPSPHAFPTPIHDAAIAFEYIFSSFSRTPSNCTRRPKICLFGSQIGGALATMLALTQPNDMLALAVCEPLVDWVGLDEYVRPLRGPKTKKPTHFSDKDEEAARSLIPLRASLFRTPGAYFDPFASPTLFLRAPGQDTPYQYAVAGDIDLSNFNSLPAEVYGPYDDDLDSLPSRHYSPSTSSSSPTPDIVPDSLSSTTTSTTSTTSTTTTLPPKRRKVLRRWPSTGPPESVVLPQTRIFVRSPQSTPPIPAASAILRAQGIELAELMRRACFSGRERGFAEARVGVEEVVEEGPRTTTTTATVGLERAALWLREKFEEEEEL